MEDYFRNMNSLDPLFHAIVLSRLRELQGPEGSPQITINDLTQEDELAILRKYSVTLYKEYRTLRTVFLENMAVTGRSVGLKYQSN